MALRKIPGKNQVYNIFICLMRLKICEIVEDQVQSGKFWEDEDENLIFPRHFTQRDEGPSGISSDFAGQSDLSSMHTG